MDEVSNILASLDKEGTIQLKAIGSLKKVNNNSSCIRHHYSYLQKGPGLEHMDQLSKINTNLRRHSYPY